MGHASDQPRFCQGYAKEPVIAKPEIGLRGYMRPISIPTKNRYNVREGKNENLGLTVRFLNPLQFILDFCFLLWQRRYLREPEVLWGIITAIQMPSRKC